MFGFFCFFVFLKATLLSSAWPVLSGRHNEFAKLAATLYEFIIRLSIFNVNTSTFSNVKTHYKNIILEHVTFHKINLAKNKVAIFGCGGVNRK